MSSQDVSRCNHGSVSPIFAGDLLYGFGLEKRLPLWREAAHRPLCSPFLCRCCVLQPLLGPPGGTTIALRKPPGPHQRHGLYFSKHLLENGKNTVNVIYDQQTDLSSKRFIIQHSKNSTAGKF